MFDPAYCSAASAGASGSLGAASGLRRGPWRRLGPPTTTPRPGCTLLKDGGGGPAPERQL